MPALGDESFEVLVRAADDRAKITELVALVLQEGLYEPLLLRQLGAVHKPSLGQGDQQKLKSSLVLYYISDIKYI